MDREFIRVINNGMMSLRVMCRFVDSVMEPRVLAYGNDFDGCDNLHNLSKDDLIRRVRQLNLLVLSSGSRASVLSEDIRRIQTQRLIENNELCAERDLLQMELSDLKRRVVLLECAVKTKQECIDCCDAEISGLKAVIHYFQSETNATGMRIGFLLHHDTITPDGPGC